MATLQHQVRERFLSELSGSENLDADMVRSSGDTRLNYVSNWIGRPRNTGHILRDDVRYVPIADGRCSDTARCRLEREADPRLEGRCREARK